MDGAVARLAAARSAGRRRRIALVDRTVGQCAWAPRSQNRRTEGISRSKTPNPRPHGLTEDSAGNIWYTGNGKGTVGKLDPKTGDRSPNIPMPDPAARDPHTPIFDQKGTLWFTLAAGQHGGETQSTDRRDEARDHADGTISALRHGRRIPKACRSSCCSARTKLPASIRTRWRFVSTRCRIPPRGRGALRLRATTSSGMRTIREDIWDGSIRAPAPSRNGPRQAGRSLNPTASAWRRASSGTANRRSARIRIVRFDPRTEQFQTWAIPSGGGVVRNMMTTKDGDLVLACSGVNKVGLVDIR